MGSPRGDAGFQVSGRRSVGRFGERMEADGEVKCARKRQTHGETEMERRDREPDKDRHTKRQTDRWGEMERDRDTEMDRETHMERETGRWK